MTNWQVHLDEVEVAARRLRTQDQAASPLAAMLEVAYLSCLGLHEILSENLPGSGPGLLVNDASAWNATDTPEPPATPPTPAALVAEMALLLQDTLAAAAHSAPIPPVDTDRLAAVGARLRDHLARHLQGVHSSYDDCHRTALELAALNAEEDRLRQEIRELEAKVADQREQVAGLARGLEVHQTESAGLLLREQDLEAERAELHRKIARVRELETECQQIIVENQDLDSHIQQRLLENQTLRENRESLKGLLADLQRQENPQLAEAITAIWKLLPGDEFDARSQD